VGNRVDESSPTSKDGRINRVSDIDGEKSSISKTAGPGKSSSSKITHLILRTRERELWGKGILLE